MANIHFRNNPYAAQQKLYYYIKNPAQVCATYYYYTTTSMPAHSTTMERADLGNDEVLKV